MSFVAPHPRTQKLIIIQLMIQCFDEYRFKSTEQLRSVCCWLTHCGLMTTYGVPELGHHWLRSRAVSYSTPSHYLNQCWLIINWILRNNWKSNLNQNELVFCQENAFENGISKISTICSSHIVLTHWGRVAHICVSNLTIIGSDNGLSPGRRQAIIWTNAGILLIGPLETNFSEISIKIHVFSFKKMHLKMSSGKWRPFCLGLNVLTIV